MTKKFPDCEDGDPPLCKCGKCCLRVKWNGREGHWNTYINGHYINVKHPMEDPKNRKAVSISRTGSLPWNTGLNKETDKRVKEISEMRKGKKRTEKQKERIRNGMLLHPHSGWNKGLHGSEYLSHFKDGKLWITGLTKETDERVRKISEKGKGRIVKQETKDKLSRERKGKSYEERYGIEKARDVKRKLSEKIRRREDHEWWKGGHSYYFGPNWFKVRNELLEERKHSEVSGKSGVRLNVHHIYSRRIFIKVCIDLIYKKFIDEINYSSLEFLQHDMIPSVIYNEMNSKNNLIVLTASEHSRYENMPPTFFDAIRRENNDID